MADCSEKKNPLIRNGTSQPERFLPGLKDDFVKIDERSYADLISFGSALSRFLNYFDQKNEISGDWSVFMESDISSVLAALCIQDIKEYKYQIKKRFDFIKDDDNKDNLASLKRKLYELFSALATLTYALDKIYPRLEAVSAYQSNYFNLVKNKIRPALRDLIAYYKGAQDEGLLVVNNLSKWDILNLELKPAETIFADLGLGKIWFPESFPSWEDYYNSINSDTGIFQYPLVQPGDPQSKIDYEKIYHGINHNLFSRVFDQFLYAYSKIIKDASAELDATLASFPEHQPHYTLFLTFLKLFWEAKDSLNSLGKRHLDFYYKEVLNLYNKKAQPDSAHALIELIKSREEFGLSSGTEFKAGKDSIGNEVLYDLEKDTVFNKAKINSLKSIYLANENDNIIDPLDGNTIEDNENRLFAAPAVNSEDGLGAELQSEFKEWHPIVNRKYKESTVSEISMPKGQIGFAIASHYLFLGEGDRKLIVRLNTSNNTAFNNKQFKCYVTGEEGWLNIGQPSISASGKKFTDNVTSCVELRFNIAPDFPAITNYSEKVFKEKFDVELPILKIYIRNNSDDLYKYDTSLQDLIINKIEIHVKVGDQNEYSQSGLKNITVSGVHGVIDPAKAFQPYGAQPTAGSKFILGGKEVFSKNNLTLGVNIEWKNHPNPNSSSETNKSSKSSKSKASESQSGLVPESQLPEDVVMKVPYVAPIENKVSIKCLNSGVWQKMETTDSFFTESKTYLEVSGDELKNTITPYSEPSENFNIESQKGYINIELKEGFGHKEYIKEYTKFLINESKENKDLTITEPEEPYTPEVQSLYLSYSAHEELDLSQLSENQFQESDIKLFGLYPFGIKPQYTKDTGEDIYLFPQFRTEVGEPFNVGEFYIGLENLKPNQGVNILFQVLEGSTDPLQLKPDNHIHWSYLSENEWETFEKGAIQDSTLNLTNSGIIAFAIPGDASLENLMFPAGLIWIRASIQSAADTICKFLAVETQAALLNFDNHDNAQDFLDTALPAESISKLKIPQAAVKKVLQPFSSFGGRPREDDEHYYTRVSERLRHRDRAVTIWDFEHLVLEAFPEIYRVKCLNHAGIELSGSNTNVLNEVSPGNVLIITIPQLQNRNDSNPLKPYTNQSTLIKIQDFLKERVSPFVNLQAVQPQFEELRLKFNLKLLTGYNDFEYYAGILRESITRYLTPWAFGQETEVHFGGTVYKSELIDFIEEQHYVDFITEVEMYVKVKEGENESNDMEQIDASTARSILVSSPSSKHTILNYD